MAMTTDFRFNGLMWTPGSTRAERRKFRCRVCNVDLHEGEYQAHVVKCAMASEHELRSESLRVKAPHFMGDEGWDKEFYEYVNRGV
jgi:hypothetical protein